MRSKKYAGELCVYCNSKPAVVLDHVFARKFFLLNQRGTLPQVPACDQCNNEKSRLEYRLTALLPFGGRHADALTNLETMVPKRLAKNARLHSELAHGRGTTWNRSKGGLLVRQMTLPMGGQLEKLFEFIAKGLLWHHWKVRLTDDHTVVAGLVPDNFLDPFSKVPPDRRVNVNLGGGTASYQGLQGDDYPEVSAWEFTIYGGLEITDETQQPPRTYRKIGATTSHKRVAEKAESLRRLKSGRP
jgi:hypothetical protein